MKKEERVCKECDSREGEDVCHWLLQCSAWDHLRQPLLEGSSHGDASTNYHIPSVISSMRPARF